MSIRRFLYDARCILYLLCFDLLDLPREGVTTKKGNARQERGGTIKKGNQKHREEPVYPHARTIAEEGEKQVDDDYKSTRTTTELSPTPYFGYSLVALADTHLHAIIKEPISSFVCCHHRLCID